MAVREEHSADGTAYIRRNEEHWDVYYDNRRVATLPTRHRARVLIRDIKADPALAAVALVQLS